MASFKLLLGLIATAALCAAIATAAATTAQAATPRKPSLQQAHRVQIQSRWNLATNSYCYLIVNKAEIPFAPHFPKKAGNWALECHWKNFLNGCVPQPPISVVKCCLYAAAVT